MKIRIKALDTLFFRDGRPFDRGDDTWADSVFPPSPATIYGAIRAAYLNQMPDVAPDSDNDPTRNIKINGIYFEINNTLHFHAPRDFVIKNSDVASNHYEMVPLNLLKPETDLSSAPTSYVPNHNDDVDNLSDGLIQAGEYDSYLNEYLDAFTGKCISSLLSAESRSGIGLNKDTATVNEGELYNIFTKRMQNNFNLIVDLEPPELNQKAISFIRLGGENRTAEIETLTDIEYNSETSYNWENPSGKYFKLHLLTPALFKNGWYPALKDLLGLEEELLPIAAFTDKPSYIGGFDIQKNAPKTMYRMAPAGSVFYYAIRDGQSTWIFDKLMQLSNLNDIKQAEDCRQKSKEGFGLFKTTYLPLENILL